MKRTSILRLHLAATIVAAITVSLFFTMSLYAEINGDTEIIKEAKSIIFYSLPILLVVMPVLKISGDKLASNSKSSVISRKKKTMNIIAINGLFLIAMAIFLYYRSHYQSIDETFLGVQIAELFLGLTNLFLIGLNAYTGMKLSGRIK